MRKLGRMLVLALGCSALAHAQGVSPLGPQRPTNPADSIVVSDDSGVCETGPEKTFRMIEAVASRCAATFAGNASDYAWIGAHLFAEFWVPLKGEVMLVEFKAKLGKDATVCLLTGFVEAGGGSPQARELAKAAIEEIRELIDRKSYWDKSTKAWNDLSNYGQDYLLTNNDHRKFLSYLDKKTFDRLKNTQKESNLLEKVLNFQDPTWKAKSLVPEAREALDSCDLPKAAATLEAAKEIHLSWLRQVRETVVQLKKELRCLKEEHWRSQPMAPDGGSVASVQARDRYVELKDRTQFELERFRGLDIVEQIALREVGELAASIENRSRIVDETLRGPFERAAAAGQQLMDRCDFEGAQRSFDELKQYTRNPACGSQLKHEYFRELKLLEDLQARRDYRVENEARVARLYAEALAHPASDCITLAQDASFLRLATEKVCLDRTATDARIRALEDRARACGGGDVPSTDNIGEAASAVLTRQAPIPDDPKNFAGTWTIADGKVTQENYSGEYVYKGTFTWSPPPPANVGPQGFSITMSATCTVGPRQGPAAMGIGISAEGFDLVKSLSDRTPVKHEEAQLPMNCGTGQTKSGSLTVYLMPHASYSEGFVAKIKIGAFWGAGVTYRYVAGAPKQ